MLNQELRLFSRRLIGFALYIHVRTVDDTMRAYESGLPMEPRRRDSSDPNP
jgi:hypothetical protein